LITLSPRFSSSSESLSLGGNISSGIIPLLFLLSEQSENPAGLIKNYIFICSNKFRTINQLLRKIYSKFLNLFYLIAFIP
jgi:hypothetical protein